MSFPLLSRCSNWLPSRPLSPISLLTVIDILALSVGLVAFFYRFERVRPKDGFPTVSETSAYGTICEYIKSVFWLNRTLEEGYRKFKSSPFKVSEPGRWRVMINSRTHLEEIRKAPATVMELQPTLNEILSSEYTLGHTIANDGLRHDFATVKVQLVRDYDMLLPDMLNELDYVFDEMVPNLETQWTSVPALHTMTALVCKIMSRVLVGSPTCRNEDFLHIAYHHSESVMKVATFVRFLPKSLRSTTVKYFTSLPTMLEKAIDILGPTIEFRMQQTAMYGESWPGKTDDVLSWLIDIAKGEQRSVKVITEYVMAISFASIHTTSMTLTHALYQMAITRECIDPLREEVTQAVETEGFTKAAFSRMKLLDSFIKETMRVHGIGIYASARAVLQDFTFADGTFLPAGTHLAANALSIHHDEEFYKDAHIFSPYRFVNEENFGKVNLKKNATTATTEYLAFGYGRFSCPGRYLAIIEIKAVMAKILMHREFKIDGEENKFPKSINILQAIVPNPFTRLNFRKRSQE